jgi:hypothetical protein
MAFTYSLFHILSFIIINSIYLQDSSEKFLVIRTVICSVLLGAGTFPLATVSSVSRDSALGLATGYGLDESR